MEKTITLHDVAEGIQLLGNLNGHARIIEEHLAVGIELTASGIRVVGEALQVDRALLVLQRLLAALRSGAPIEEQLVRYLTDLVQEGRLEQAGSFSPDLIAVTAKGRPILSKTAGQKRYVDAISESVCTFAIGPAGTGKTYLAVAKAVQAFRAEAVSRIILTRPAVEAGEKLGFLPGDLQNKVDPYMRPLYDALHELMGTETYQRNMEKGLIEVSPLAYMRGRTLDEAFIILDEAQNTTPEQMKMFLTRIGFNSRVVVTGDITQIDLPPSHRSGLLDARTILRHVEGISFVELSQRDVVRNPLVQRIIQAYERTAGKGGRS